MVEQRLYVFCLGAPSLAMREVHRMMFQERLQHATPSTPTHFFFDFGLKGMTTSAYEVRIREFAAKGYIPVLLELEEDVRNLPQGTMQIRRGDGKLPGDSVVALVAKLLGREMSEYERWVAAFDRGGVQGALKAGLPPEEALTFVDEDGFLRRGHMVGEVKV